MDEAIDISDDVLAIEASPIVLQEAVAIDSNFRGGSSFFYGSFFNTDFS